MAAFSSHLPNDPAVPACGRFRSKSNPRCTPIWCQTKMRASVGHQSVHQRRFYNSPLGCWSDHRQLYREHNPWRPLMRSVSKLAKVRLTAPCRGSFFLAVDVLAGQQHARRLPLLLGQSGNRRGKQFASRRWPRCAMVALIPGWRELMVPVSGLVSRHWRLKVLLLQA